MKINEKHLKELRECELYQRILPRYQKNIEWMLREYIKATEEENIETSIYFVTPMENGTIKLHSVIKDNINQRRLLNLNALNFDFGLHFISDHFMPFFGENEIGLFEDTRCIEDVENGEICLVADSVFSDKVWLAIKEETGFFELDCTYLDDGAGLVLLGKLVNVETR